MTSCISHLACPKCDKTYACDQPTNLCECGSPLLVRYDLDRARATMSKQGLKAGPATMWRYRRLLPVTHDANIVTLGEGWTPLLEAENLSRRLGIELLIKDEGLNPTGTFKARGASTGASKAKELGIEAVALPTSGNAGAAWSAYAAKAGLTMIVAMPEDARELPKKECTMAGAHVFLVKGRLPDAGKAVSEAAAKHGWFEVATLKEPYRVEGKKTIGFEIAEQLDWTMPDVILCPTGGGVGVIGIWKAVQELEAMGWLDGKRPRMVSVQAEGCRPIVDAFEQGKERAEFYENAHCIAPGLCAPKVLGDVLVLQACRESRGTAVAVTDEEILDSMKLLARTEGILACPEGAAGMAAVRKLREAGVIKEGERVCMLNTGSGLKYGELMTADFPVSATGDSIKLP